MNSTLAEQQVNDPFIPVQNDAVSLYKVENKERLLLGNSSFELNATGKLVWSLCKGNFNTNEIIDLVTEAYPDMDGNSDSQVISLVNKLAEHKLLRLYTLPEFESAAPWDAETTFVYYHRPTPEMLWHLESVRQFVSGLYEPFESQKSETRPEESSADALSIEELGLAKLQDANTARSIGKGELEQYRHFTRSATFSSHIKAIQNEIASLIPDIEANIRPSGHAYYHSKGYMGWHSNHKMPGTRVYCTWTEKDKTNFFRYEDPVSGDLVTHWEPAGWTIKSFQIPPSPYRLWHCIQADSHRFALGFRATDKPQSAD